MAAFGGACVDTFTESGQRLKRESIGEALPSPCSSPHRRDRTRNLASVDRSTGETDARRKVMPASTKRTPPSFAWLLAVAIAVTGSVSCSGKQHPAGATTRPPSTSEASASWDVIKDAAIPSTCEHPATTLVDGVDETLTAEQGHFQLLQSLPDGSPGFVGGLPSDAGPLTAVIFNCDAGGVGWPDQVMFFTADGRYLTHADLYEAIDWESTGLEGPGRNGVTSIALKGNSLYIHTLAYVGSEPACCPRAQAELRMRIQDGKATVTSVKRLRSG